MNAKNGLLIGAGILVVGVGIAGAVAAVKTFILVGQVPAPSPAAAAAATSRPETPRGTPSFTSRNRPQDRGSECDKPSVTVTEPAPGSTIGREPVFVSGGLSPNTPISIHIDSDFYLFPAERTESRLIESAKPRTAADGNFRLQLDLSGDRVVFTGEANAMGVVPTRGLSEGVHRFLISEELGACAAFSQELHYTVRSGS